MGKRHQLLYAASDIDANMLYASRFSAPDPFVFVITASGRRWMMASDLEIDRARKESTAHRVFSLSEYARMAREKNGRATMPDIIATFLKANKIRSVAVPNNFPAGMAEALRKRGITVAVQKDPFFAKRVIKTPAEIKAIRQTMRITEKGVKAGMETLAASRIKNGYLYHKGKRLTSERLRSTINTTILAEGCMPMYTIVAGGNQGCDPHDKGSGPLRAHQPIIIDVFPRAEDSGYFGDITRTVVRGKASQQVKAMFNAVRAAQRLGCKMIKHGANGSLIHEAIADLFISRGFETGRAKGRMQGFFHGTGHGLGLDIHEPPRIAPNGDTLRAGMVTTVEPGLYYCPTGGVRIEDTVAVTRSGIDNLTRFPKFLEL